MALLRHQVLLNPGELQSERARALSPLRLCDNTSHGLGIVDGANNLRYRFVRAYSLLETGASEKESIPIVANAAQT